MAQDLQVETHESFIKTPEQLAVVVFLAFAVPIAIIVLLSQYVTGGLHTDAARNTEEMVAARLKPVGEVVLGEAPPPAATPAVKAAAGPVDGKGIYEKNCAACHAAGVMNAPKVGDKGSWSTRISQGKDTLYQHAIKGIRGMPAKGGNAALADAEVKAAVDHMVGASK